MIFVAHEHPTSKDVKMILTIRILGTVSKLSKCITRLNQHQPYGLVNHAASRWSI